MKNLIFNGRIGYRPEPGTLEHLFIAGCAEENKEVWDRLASCSRQEMEMVIKSLIELGWGFEWVTVH